MLPENREMHTKLFAQIVSSTLTYSALLPQCGHLFSAKSENKRSYDLWALSLCPLPVRGVVSAIKVLVTNPLRLPDVQDTIVVVVLGGFGGGVRDA